MDFQTMINNAIAASRAEELSTSPQLLLGEMTLKLEAVKNKNLPIFIDIMDKRPMGVNSWRGSYCELSIQTESFGSYKTDKIEGMIGDYALYKYQEIGKINPSVEEWINVLKEAVGKTFTGYKGGDYLASKNTPVWLAEYGNASFNLNGEDIDEEDYSNYKNVFFVNVEERKNGVYLVTQVGE